MLAFHGGRQRRAGAKEMQRLLDRKAGDRAGPLLPLIAAAMNLRSRLTGITTGDQAMFVTRGAFEAAGGFPEIALMEDIALCKRLKRVSRPLCISERVVTSGRRWEKNGVLATMLLMWRLRMDRRGPEGRWSRPHGISSLVCSCWRQAS